MYIPKTRNKSLLHRTGIFSTQFICTSSATWTLEAWWSLAQNFNLLRAGSCYGSIANFQHYHQNKPLVAKVECVLGKAVSDLSKTLTKDKAASEHKVSRTKKTQMFPAEHLPFSAFPWSYYEVRRHKGLTEGSSAEEFISYDSMPVQKALGC